MSVQFQKLTHKQIRELQYTAQNILQSCQEGRSLYIQKPDEKTAINNNNETTYSLYNELFSRNTIITELANMTSINQINQVFILEQFSRCIQEKEDLLQQNLTKKQKIENKDIQLLDIKEQIEQLKIQNIMMYNKYEILASEKDLVIQRNQNLVNEFQRFKFNWQQQKRSLKLQLQNLHTKIRCNEQNIKNNKELNHQLTQLCQKNQKLKNQLIKTQKQLDFAVHQLQQTRQKVSKLGENPISNHEQKEEDVSLKISISKDEQILQSSKKNTIMLRSSNLKFQLQDLNIQSNDQWSIYHKQGQSLNNSAICQIEADEILKKQEILLKKQEKLHQNMKQRQQKSYQAIKGIKQSKFKVYKMISIQNSSQCGLQADYHQLEGQNNYIRQQNKSVIFDDVQNKIQTLPLKIQIPNFKKKKQQNVSRIKYLMNNIGGGSKNYDYHKKNKRDRFKTQRSQDSRIQTQKLTNKILDKKVTIQTSTTLTTHLSSIIFPKRLHS